MTNTEPYLIQVELGGTYRKTEVERSRGGRGSVLGGCFLPGFGAGGGADTKHPTEDVSPKCVHLCGIWLVLKPNWSLLCVVQPLMTCSLQPAQRQLMIPQTRQAQSLEKPSVHSLGNEQMRAERNLTGREAVHYKEKSVKSRFNFHTLYPPSPWIKVNNLVSFSHFIFSK